MTSGDIGEARRRLVRLILSQRHGDPPLHRPIHRREVREGELSSYVGDEAHKPENDWILVTRFFERVWNAQRERSFDDLAVVTLIGRQACWWDVALHTDEDEHERDRRALSEFAQWSNRYQKEHPHEPRLADWGGKRQSQFGISERPPVPPAGERPLSWFRRDIIE
jgi:hypothetical protein